MHSLLRFSAWTAALLILAGFVFGASERQFLVRYITHEGDPLVLPISWYEPVEQVKGRRNDDLPIASEQTRTIPANVLHNVSSFAEEQKSQALIIVQDGVIQLESYWEGADRNTLFNPQSMSKTVLGMLMGIAIEEGHIDSVDDPVGKYLEEWSNDARGTATYPPNPMDGGRTGANGRLL